MQEAAILYENKGGIKLALENLADASLINDNKKIANDISDRLSQEIIIALIGPVGSGVSTAGKFLEEVLRETFAYKVCPILKPSTIIKAEASRVSMVAPPREPLNEYIDVMQTAGNSLREKFGGNYLTEKIVELISKFRTNNGGYKDDVALPGRRAYIIDSLKNQEELDLLRSIYGETLCVFGVFAPDGIRKNRLESDGVPPDQVKKIIDRDQSEIATFGQNTRKLFVQADFFVCNDRKEDELRSRIVRFLNIMFDTSVHTPTRAESAMYEASAAAANSACMSRQVGAAIVSKGGELIAVGWNDVPRFGGGLYSEDSRSVYDDTSKSIVDRDHRCFNWGGKICHNENRRFSIIDAVVRKISDKGYIEKGITVADIKKILVGTEIDSLIEFSRSIHAEMEAILSVAREGKHSLAGATLYTSVYPCHNCARHIVASGIESVVYIEPYLKSLAIDLHNDVITEDPNDIGKVIFRQFDGVAPRNYLKLFKPTADRKFNGKLSKSAPNIALPVFRIQLDSQAQYEDKVIADLSHKEQTG